MMEKKKLVDVGVCQKEVGILPWQRFAKQSKERES
jgi:hypothetical protein